MKKIVIGCFLSFSFLFSNVSIIECKGCHGVDFKTPALGTSKVLADMSVDEIQQALLGYKNGTFGYGAQKVIMEKFAKKLSASEILELAKEIKK